MMRIFLEYCTIIPLTDWISTSLHSSSAVDYGVK